VIATPVLAHSSCRRGPTQKPQQKSTSRIRIISGAHSHVLIVFVLAITVAFVLACNSSYRDLHRDLLLELSELEYRMLNHTARLYFT
jgi:hypothetical protein